MDESYAKTVTHLNPNDPDYDDQVVKKWDPVLRKGGVPHSEQVEVARTLEGVGRALNPSAGLSASSRTTLLNALNKMLPLLQQAQQP